MRGSKDGNSNKPRTGNPTGTGTGDPTGTGTGDPTGAGAGNPTGAGDNSPGGTAANNGQFQPTDYTGGAGTVDGTPGADSGIGGESGNPLQPGQPTPEPINPKTGKPYSRAWQWRQRRKREDANFESVVKGPVTSDGPRVKSSAATKKAAESATQTAAILLILLDGVAVSMFGEAGRRTQFERTLTDEPLARWIERLPVETLEVVERYTDPVLLIFGLGVWGSRLYRLNAEATEKATPAPARSVTPAPAPAPANGRKPEPAPDTIPSAMIGQDIRGMMGGL